MAANRLLGRGAPAILLQQLGRAAMHGELRFQFADAPLRGGQFGPFQRAQARLHTAVDALLAAPPVDRLLADAQVSREVGDLPSHRQ